jgi:hypothetical protein
MRKLLQLQVQLPIHLERQAVRPAVASQTLMLLAFVAMHHDCLTEIEAAKEAGNAAKAEQIRKALW